MVQTINKENFEQEVGKSTIPVVIDFYADWCMPCKMMAPVFGSLSKQYEGKVKFVKINVEEQHYLPQIFGVQGIPTLVIFHNGKEVNRIVGFASLASLKSKIDQALGIATRP